ncbi:MAG: alkaline phosphatase D family protein [Aquabacterium sp.]
MQRRRLLSLWTQTAAWTAWHQLFSTPARAQGPEDAGWRSTAPLFTLGVASGEPQPDSVVLWTRLAPRPMARDGGMPPKAVEVRWEIAEDEGFAAVARSGVTVAGPDGAHSVHVEVTDLAPGRAYHYRFLAGGQVSPVGRTRTAPAHQDEPPRLRIAAASCQHYETGTFDVHREIARADVDLVIFLGDYIYETEVRPYQRVRRHPHVMSDFTLDDYRLHHASYKLDADLQAAHAAHPWLMVWDDHELLNDYAGDYAPEVPDRNEFLRMRTQAFRAYFEHLPISPRRAPVGSHMPMQARYRWGLLAEIWTLDGRQYRDRPVCQGLHAYKQGKLLWNCEDVKTPARTLLGTEQEAWLAQGLASSMCDWKIIAQPTQVSPASVKTPLGALVYGDGWDAFPAARDRLMEAIAQPRVQDVVFLSGDVHRHVAANLRMRPADAASPLIASEFAVGSVTSPGMSELLTGWMKSVQPDLLHARSEERGYALIEVTPGQLSCDFRATPHPVRPGARLHTQARYVVQRGVPGPRKAVAPRE